MGEKRRPLVAIATVLINEKNEVLVGRRKDNQLFNCPGGHLERYEEFNQSASREIEEETGLKVDSDSIKQFKTLNVYNSELDFHFIVVMMVAKYPENQEWSNPEEDKCWGWQMMSLNEMQNRRGEMIYGLRIIFREYENRLDQLISEIRTLL